MKALFVSLSSLHLGSWTMDVPANGSSFGIDSLLSHRPASPRVSTARALTGDCRSPVSSPRSELDSDCSSPPSPRRESDPGSPLVMSQPRTVASSFLIRDILSDCRPLAACAPYTNTGDSAREPEDYTDRLHSNSSSDSEYRGKTQKHGLKALSKLYNHLTTIYT